MLIKFKNKKWGSLNSLLAEIKGNLADHIVAMVTSCPIKLTATCLPMIGQFLYHDFWHQRIQSCYNDHLGKYWKILNIARQMRSSKS